MEEGKPNRPLSICSVPPALIDPLWDALRPHVDKAIDEAHGDMDEGNLLDRLRSGQEVAMAVCDGQDIIAVGIVTVRVLDAGKRVLYISSLGGSRMSEWFEEGFALLKNMAKQYDCESVRACGRPGWARQIPGAKPIHQIYEF